MIDEKKDRCTTDRLYKCNRIGTPKRHNINNRHIHMYICKYWLVDEKEKDGQPIDEKTE